MSKPFMKTEDFTKALFNGLEALKQYETLVGIPQEKANRQDDSINNATILAINEYGSPANNIPSRPVMTIGLKMAKNEITEIFKACAKHGLSKGADGVKKYYERAGMVASQSIKNVINNQIDIEGPAESTLKARQRRGFKGNKSLIVTGQLRGAITYVVRDK